MRGAIVRIALTGVLLALASSVNARGPSSTDSFQNTFAACAVQHKLAQARQFVIGSGSPPLDRRCLGNQWSQATFRKQTFRYAIAKVLLQRDYSDGLPPEIVNVAPARIELKQIGRAPNENDEQSRLIVADCVVRMEPTKAFALVEVDAGEAPAVPLMGVLAPSIAVCSAGKQISYPNGFQMHEAIVTRMYQLAYAARKPRDA